MNFLKKTYCRVRQWIFKIALPVLPYSEPKILDSLQDIPKILKDNNFGSVMLVTGPKVRGLGLTKSLEELIKNENINLVVFDKTSNNPTIQNVEEARQIYLNENCECIIAFGGGSPMDCAKALGARIACPNKTLSNLKGILHVKKKIPMLIAVPTTAGSGSEVTPVAVITDSEKQYKYIVMDFNLTPSYAVLDPNVTFTLPQNQTATTGMDALTHAVEAYIGRSTTKTTRSNALEAVKLIFENIEDVYHKNDKLARANMLKASYLAGLAFSKSYVGYIHSVAHSLGGQYNVSHGLANAVIMPIMLEVYGKTIHKKLYELATYSGIAEKSDSYETASKKFIEKIKILNKNMNIPETLACIKQEDIEIMSKYAEKEANPLYPVPKLLTQKQLAEIYYLVGGIQK